MRSLLVLGWFLLLICSNCLKEEEFTDRPWSGNTIPRHFPQITYPADNAFDPAKTALGKALFFDPILSKDSTVSCSSCHQPSLFFTDGQVKSIGVAKRVGARNTPSLLNVAFSPYFLSEGGVPTLEMQVLVPVQEHAEMDDNILRVVGRIQKVEKYRQMSVAAFGKLPDAYVITRAIANYERTLVSGTSPYDDFLAGVPNGMSVLAQEGMQLFQSSRLGCAQCHAGVLFTDFKFYNNGIDNGDAGRERLTENIQDLGKFKVPGLRNVANTAPYMHDGSLANLQEVIRFYAGGGGSHPNKDPRLKPFVLSDREQEALIAFLEALTDIKSKKIYEDN